jgi:hypothetical protein
MLATQPANMKVHMLLLMYDLSLNTADMQVEARVAEGGHCAAAPLASN